MKLLVDAPRAADESAQFDEDFVADLLAITILETDARFNVGIYGGWGTGKTTLLKRLRSKLAESRDEQGSPESGTPKASREKTGACLVVEYSAWAHQHFKDPLLPFTAEIEAKLRVARGQEWRKWKPQVRRQRSRRRLRWLSKCDTRVSRNCWQLPEWADDLERIRAEDFRDAAMHWEELEHCRIVCLGGCLSND